MILNLPCGPKGLPGNNNKDGYFGFLIECIRPCFFLEQGFNIFPFHAAGGRQ